MLLGQSGTHRGGSEYLAVSFIKVPAVLLAMSSIPCTRAMSCSPGTWGPGPGGSSPPGRWTRGLMYTVSMWAGRWTGPGSGDGDGGGGGGGGA